MDGSILKDPCKDVATLSELLPQGLWVNLLTLDLETAIQFQSRVLGAHTFYQDDAFAILGFAQSVWLVHSTDTYQNHPLSAHIGGGLPAAGGIELRLKGRNPDQAVKAAKDFSCQVIEPPKNKPHAMREAFIKDPDGNIWVPCQTLETT